MRPILFITVILLIVWNFAADAGLPYGYPPAPYYTPPAPVHRGYPPQFHYPQPYFEPVRYHQPVLPFPSQAPSEPARKAPEMINHKATGTVAMISQPHSVIKPVVTEVAEPKKPEPKKVLSDSKLVFLNKIAPIIHKVNAEVLVERDQLASIITILQQGNILSTEQTDWLNATMKKYRVKGKAITAEYLKVELLPRVDVIPVELALAQAANESAWGKSRFAREAQNLFGVWTYDESKGIVPKKRARGAKHLVRKYESIDESISDYITLLNSHPAYQPLRDIRLESRNDGRQPDGFMMAQGLVKYSARGEQYVSIIRSMINKNNLTDFRSA
jgi:Bax protein